MTSPRDIYPAEFFDEQPREESRSSYDIACEMERVARTSKRIEDQTEALRALVAAKVIRDAEMKSVTNALRKRWRTEAHSEPPTHPQLRSWIGVYGYGELDLVMDILAGAAVDNPGLLDPTSARRYVNSILMNRAGIVVRGRPQ